MNAFRFLSWACLTMTAVASGTTWGLEVQGVTLGTTTVADAAKFAQFSTPPGSKGCAGDSCSLSGTVGSMPVRVHLFSPKSAADGVIHSVTISTSDNRYEMFKEGLIAKYGPPTSEIRKTDTMSQRGTKYERMVAIWALPDGKIELDERTPIAILGYTQIVYQTAIYAIEVERQRKEHAESVKKGL
jgi:hypothetical protein